MVNADVYHEIRPARANDLTDIMALIEPFEKVGALVSRPKENLEESLGYFSVIERDNAIIACAAGIPLSGDVVELACLAVQSDYRRSGYGDGLLSFVEQRALKRGAGSLLVLTTQATHWFRERGFVEVDKEALPSARLAAYDPARASVFLEKRLTDSRASGGPTP